MSCFEQLDALSEVVEKKYVAFFNIVWDPDPHSAFNLVGQIRIQIQDGENDHCMPYFNVHYSL